MSETFLVLVGDDQKPFTLYKNIATRSFKFFQAAMNRNWLECQEENVTLAEVQVGTFECYLQWLNTGDITFEGDPSTSALARFYILGDFLDDVSFRNAVLDEIVNQACHPHRVPSLGAIRLAWEQTPAGCPLRKLILEIWATRSTERTAGVFADPDFDCPKASIVDYFQHLVAFYGVSRPAVSDKERIRRLEECRHELAVE